MLKRTLKENIIKTTMNFDLPIFCKNELRSLSKDPAFQRMLKYAFVGSKETVQQTEDFLNKTGVNELSDGYLLTTTINNFLY